tara:strand:+ start:1319 stop:2554 length:1236 start_codon:yes stop_codon:yes gene_type:complete
MKFLKNTVLKFVNSPEPNVLSSQTLYEMLFYANNRYLQTSDLSWFDKGRAVAGQIIDTQLPDGGFDIGYDFLFGSGLRKSHDREGTSPEVLSLVALCAFYKIHFPRLDDVERQSILSAIHKGADWILRFCIDDRDGVAIPYAPHSYDGVHITNATSFAVSALAAVFDVLPAYQSDVVREKIEGMYRFTFNQLERSSEGSAYWPYFYSKDESAFSQYGNDKVDNYHIAQQLYHHFLAGSILPSQYNDSILHDVSNYLLGILDGEGFLPYTTTNGVSSDKVDLWGFSSLVPAYIKAYQVFGGEEFLQAAQNVCFYIFRYCRCDSHFYPIVLNSSKTTFDSNFYPRSDAWVIHSLSELFFYPELVTSDQVAFADSVFDKIQNSGCRGLENHTLTFRKLVFAKVVKIVKSFLGKQ